MEPGLDVCGPYRDLKAIGWGGMGVVYAATHSTSGERHALKIMRDVDESDLDHQRDRFLREVAATRRLEHPNIIPVLDSGIHERHCWYAMPLLESVEFDQWAAKKPIASVIEALATIAEAMAHAHAHGVLHRDLKPANIMVDKQTNHVYVTDFGLSRLMDSGINLTQSSEAIGTPAYMAPEQALCQHERCNGSTDVWALGVILYEYVVGFLPFRGQTPLEFMRSITDHDPVRPRRHIPSIDPGLERIILQCLEKNQDRRYRSATELAADLRRLQHGKPVLARRYGLMLQFRRQIERRWRQVAVVGTVSCLVALAVVVLLQNYYDRWGVWSEVYSWSADQGPLSDARYLLGDLQTAVPPWEMGTNGLVMRPTQWAWFDQMTINGDVRVEAEVAIGRYVDGVEIVINANDTMPDGTYKGAVPVSYSCQFGGWAGFIDFVACNRQPQNANTAYAVATRMRPHQRYRLALERLGDHLRLYVDGDLAVEARFTLPLAGDNLGQFGIRGQYGDYELCSLRVLRRAAPRQPDPLTSGDTMVQLGRFDRAYQEYLLVAQAYDGSALGEQAMAKAFLVALQLDGIAAEDIARLRKRLQAIPEPDALTQEALASEAAWHWSAGRPDQALDIAEQILAKDPSSRVAMTCLAADMESVSPKQRDRLLELIGRTEGITALTLRELGITSIENLTGLPLQVLDVVGNEIDDLTPLAGMPLTHLRIDRNLIHDLSPLVESQLEYLSANNNAIGSLAALADMPSLKTLRIGNNPLSSVDALRGMAFDRLDIGRSAIQDLSPLHGSRIDNLDVAYLDLGEATDFRHWRLESLNAPGTGLTDLTRIPSEHLLELDISNCPLAQVDLSQMQALIRLRANNCGLDTITGLEQTPLRNLQLMGNHLSRIPVLPPTIISLQMTDNQVTSIDGTDLAPSRLTIAGNPITDAAAFVNDPLYDESYHIRSDRLPANNALQQLATCTDRKVGEAATTIIALLDGNRDSLLTRAVSLAGHRYLAIPIKTTFDQARTYAASVGASLPTVRNADHAQTIFNDLNWSVHYWVANEPGPQWPDGSAMIIGERDGMHPDPATARIICQGVQGQPCLADPSEFRMLLLDFGPEH